MVRTSIAIISGKMLDKSMSITRVLLRAGIAWVGVISPCMLILYPAMVKCPTEIN
jgi:hypothetical protein